MRFASRTSNTNGGRWHYINLPFKPEGQPPSVQTREPEPVNILVEPQKLLDGISEATDNMNGTATKA
jgi:hypothetical protein